MKKPFDFYSKQKTNLENEAALLKKKSVNFSLFRFGVFLTTCFLIYLTFGKYPDVFIIAFLGILLFAFLATLLLITINNIWRRFEIKKYLNIIKKVIIVTGVIVILKIFYLLYSNLDNIKPFTESDIFVVIALFLPFFLFIKKLGRNKYFILLVPFLIFLLFFISKFERVVILVTSLYRGHMPASWVSYYPTWQELPIFIVKTLLISAPFILLIINIVVYIIRKIKHSPSTHL